MRTVRLQDVDAMNHLANTPEVRPYLLGKQVIDITDQVADLNNFAFWNEAIQMGFIMIRVDVETVEVHTIARPRGDFKVALEYAEMVRDWVFINTTITRMYTKVAKKNAGARLLATKQGFRTWHDLGVPMDGEYMEVLSLSLDRWASICSRAQLRGHTFHAELEPLLEEGADHEDDETHDRFVGAAILIAEEGRNPVKGLDLYNRWAVVAGYAPVEIVSGAPLVVHIGTALVGMVGERMEILKCL